MSTYAKNSLHTGYWENYDLQSDPFVELDTNYTSPRWNESLELLHHLSLYSNVMLTVIGDAGVGRHLFFEQFRTKISMHIEECAIKADPYFDQNALLDTLLEAYGFTGVGGVGRDFSDKATSLLSNIERSEKALILIIDDAHTLSESMIDALLFFVKAQPTDNALLHIVLFGDAMLQSKLSMLEQSIDSDSFMHTVELELFSLEDTERYLRYKIHQVAPEGVFPFSNQEVLEIYKLSEGQIEQIDPCARRTLLERAVSKPPMRLWFSSKAAVLFALAILTTATGWYWLHRWGNPYSPYSTQPLIQREDWKRFGGSMSDGFKRGLNAVQSTVMTWFSLVTNTTSQDPVLLKMDEVEETHSKGFQSTADNVSEIVGSLRAQTAVTKQTVSQPDSKSAISPNQFSEDHRLSKVRAQSARRQQPKQGVLIRKKCKPFQGTPLLFG